MLVWDRLAEAVGWSDRVYHMAAVVGTRRVLSDPVRVIAVNVAGCEPQVVIASG